MNDYRNRVELPVMGIFLQPDPIGMQMAGEKPSAQAAAFFPAGQAPKSFSSTETNLYRYCHNDPINKTDPLGLLPPEVQLKDRGVYEAAKAYASQTKEGRSLFSAMDKSDKKFVITTNDRNRDKTTLMKDGSVKIEWDPHSAVVMQNRQSMSPATGLTHEVDHAVRAANDPEGYRRDRVPNNTPYKSPEERRVITGSERAIATALHEAIRYQYDAAFFRRVPDVTDK